VFVSAVKGLSGSPRSTLLVFSLCLDLKYFIWPAPFVKIILKICGRIICQKSSIKEGLGFVVSNIPESLEKNLLGSVLHSKTEFVKLIDSYKPLKYAAMKIQGSSCEVTSADTVLKSC
jgi:hypothetical protein